MSSAQQHIPGHKSVLTNIITILTKIGIVRFVLSTLFLQIMQINGFLFCRCVLGQRTRCMSTEKEIDFFKGLLLGFREEEVDDRERDADVCIARLLDIIFNIEHDIGGELTPSGEEEVKPPGDCIKGDRRNLSPECRDSPVSNADGKGISSSTDLHGHDLGHIHPGFISLASVISTRLRRPWIQTDLPANRSKREREQYRYAKQESHSANAISPSRPVRILRVQRSLADEHDGNRNCSED